MADDQEDKGPAVLPYRVLRQTHPSHDRDYLRRLRALYSGGRKLLGDEVLMREVFPQHRNEHGAVYAERCRRAFYTPHAAELIDHLVASLMAVPVDVELVGLDGEPRKDVPETWANFLTDLSPPGGEKCSMQRLLREQILNALQVKTAWTLVDMPQSDPLQYDSRAAQEKSGALDVYAVALDSEAVLDWDEDASGELTWAVVYVREQRRAGWAGNRNLVTERWVCYDKIHWEVYELPPHKEDADVSPDAPVPRVAEGPHPFGRVPLVRLCLPDGLWAMAKLEGLAREHFNKRSALAWAELQSLLPELYEFLGPEISSGVAVVGANQESDTRATDQPRGQGFVQTRGSQDRAEYVGPDSAPFAHAIKSCQDVRDEMHRVMLEMALSTESSSSAAIGRSGLSKMQDRAATVAILIALSEYVREHALLVMDMACAGRGDLDLVGSWRAGGGDKYDAAGVTEVVQQAVELSTVEIDSPTFKRLHQLGIAKAVLGANASQEDLEKIEAELEERIELEDAAKMEPPEPPPVLGQAEPGKSPMLAPGGRGQVQFGPPRPAQQKGK